MTKIIVPSLFECDELFVIYAGLMK